MSNETYTDLEQEHLNQKKSWSYTDLYETDMDRFLKKAKELAKKYPNDMEFGAKIREFINLENKL